MTVTITIRNMPASLHRRLKARATSAGLSLSAYLRNELCHLAERPTTEEMRARLERLPPMKPSVSPARVIRTERDRK